MNPALGPLIDTVSQAFDAALAGLLGQASRLHRLEPEAGESGTGAAALQGLLVEAFSLREALNAPWELEVVCLSRRAGLDLQAMLGQRVVLSTVLAHGELFKRRGLVLEAQSEEADGGLARYRLVIGPWFGLLAHSRRSQVFQDQPLVKILESIFAAYAPHAQWRLADDLAEHLARSPFHNPEGQRSYTVQYRESDLAFVQRLLAEEGVVLRFEPASDTAVLLADTPREASCPADVCSAREGGIRFHREDPTEQSDTIRAFGAERVLPVATLSAASYDYKAKRVVAASVASVGAFGGENAPRIEAYDHPGLYAFADAAAAERALVLQQESLEARHKRWLGRSVVRSFTAGTVFELQGSPLDALGGDAQRRRFVLTAVTHAGINNLPKELSDAIAGVVAGRQGRAAAKDAKGERAALLAPWVDESARAQAADAGYANAFEATRVAVPWRAATRDSAGRALQAKPTVDGPLAATVVGPQGEASASGAEEIHMDALGRVRIRFDFQRAEATPNAAPDTSARSTWVRVAQRWAGAGLGAQFLPRVGQEVLVDFLEGDIDRPIVVGSLYNGRGEGGTAPSPGGRSDQASDASVFKGSHDHAPSAQGNLSAGHSPAWHGASAAGLEQGGQRNAAAHSGIKSKEFGGGSDAPAGAAVGYNQLVFDDSDGQLRTQLATTQHATQLNLGHLIHQADNHRGGLRGLGFELRTDAYGAIRAKQGVLITTAQASASQPAGDNAAGMALGRQLNTLATTFSQGAGTHQAVKLAAQQGSTKANASSLSEQEAPLKALHTTLSAMVAAQDSDAAQADAAQRNTKVDKAKLPHPSDAIVAVQAQGGLAQVAGQDQIEAAGQTVTHAAGQDWQQATAGHWRLHTGQAIGMLAGAIKPGGQAAASGLTLIAAHKDVQLQAQADQLHIAAQKDVAIQSKSAHIDWAAARKITLATAGGASITIEGGNITVECPGKITVKAGTKAFMGPESASYPMPEFPDATLNPQKRKVRFALGALPAQMRNYAGEPYKLFADGALLKKDVADDEGAAMWEHKEGTKTYRIELVTGQVFELDVKDHVGSDSASVLANKGYRKYEHLGAGGKSEFDHGGQSFREYQVNGANGGKA